MKPLDNGRTIYTVSIEFSDDYPPFGEEGNPAGWDWAGLISQPDARVVAYADRSNPDYGLHPAEVLHRRLAQWEEHECQDAGQTIRAWTLMGVLGTITTLAAQGTPIPGDYVDGILDEVHELIGDDQCARCFRWYVRGECIPCEACGFSYCPACEATVCPKAVQA